MHAAVPSLHNTMRKLGSLRKWAQVVSTISIFSSAPVKAQRSALFCPCQIIRFLTYLSSANSTTAITCDVSTPSNKAPEYFFIPDIHHWTGSNQYQNLWYNSSFQGNNHIDVYSQHFSVDVPAGCSSGNPAVVDIVWTNEPDLMTCLYRCSFWNQQAQSGTFCSGAAWKEDLTCWLKQGLDEMSTTFVTSSEYSAGVLHHIGI